MMQTAIAAAVRSAAVLEAPLERKTRGDRTPPPVTSEDPRKRKVAIVQAMADCVLSLRRCGYSQPETLHTLLISVIEHTRTYHGKAAATRLVSELERCALGQTVSNWKDSMPR